MQRGNAMSLVPAFEIGLWNAWIPMVVLLAAAFVPLYIDYDKTTKRTEGEPIGSEQDKITKIAHVITHMVIMPLALIYSLFLPLKLSTPWLYAGLPFYLLGLVMVLMASISFSSAPLDRPMNRGIYAISRHPGYFGFFLAYVGLGIGCASWVLLLCALVWIISWRFGVIEEERILLEKYGDSYREYVDRTPRWIGMPKSRAS
jgi:protein-S-isoprenylcysteine O-methyltransferase Ste14